MQQKRRIVVGRLGLILLFCVTGCGPSGTSLTSDELQKKYPDKKYVRIDGVSLHYEQDGLGRPLVFLPGFLTSSYLWRNITPGLTYGNTIYSLDLMGSGLSEKPQNQLYSLETYVNQLSKFIDNFHLENPILGGHDIGAVVVALYTIRNPGKVRKLILMNVPLYPGYSAPGLSLLKTPLIGGVFTGDWFLKRTLQGGVLKPEAMPAATVNAYLKPYQDDPGARVALLKQVTELNLDPLLEKEVDPNLAKLSVPTLIVWGDGDPYVPLDFGRKLDAAIPNADFVVVLQTGHYEIEERPEEVRSVIKEFIDKQ